MGDLGPEAYRFADFLKVTNQSYWQMLPLNPTGTVYGNSPYSSFSAFAGNTILISPELMVKDGFLESSDIKKHPRFPKRKVNYKTVTLYKDKILKIAYAKNKEKLIKNKGFEEFCGENSYWLDDYSLFISLNLHTTSTIT
ncbi:MAG: 4-alpha-glucanotransferase, partial [Candidatus Mariimomonas ferrooxydans]